MCNLYSVTKGPQAIRQAFAAMVDRNGNLPSLPGIFPDGLAPTIRETPDGRTLSMQRWGFPAPAGMAASHLVTNIRNTASPFWRQWMQPQHRCLIPVSAFCEYAAGRPAVPHWFALDPSRPLFAFAGLWRPWHGTRGTRADPADGDHELFAFLTCAPNAVVRPIHPKAMPVILRTPAEYDLWLSGSVEQALTLQRPLPDNALALVARGARQDPPPEAPPPETPPPPRQGSLL